MWRGDAAASQELHSVAVNGRGRANVRSCLCQRAGVEESRVGRAEGRSRPPRGSSSSSPRRSGAQGAGEEQGAAPELKIPDGRDGEGRIRVPGLRKWVW